MTSSISWMGVSNSAGGGSLGGYAPSFYLPLQDSGSGIVNLTAFTIGSNTPTFTRASVAWAKLASGLWAQVATGIARSHYLGRNTAVGAYGGYLSEPAGVQLVTPTASIRNMTDASWVKVGMTVVNDVTGIDGVPGQADRITATAPNATVLQTLVAAASARTYSVFLKRRVGAGTILIMQGATTLDVTAQLNSLTYTRVELNASVLNAAFGIQINTSGDELSVDFNQFEALASTQFASSPMASAGAARAADVLTYPSAGNVDFTQGTAYAEVSTNYTAAVGTQIVLAVPSGTGLMLRLGSTDLSTTIRMSDGTVTFSKSGLSDMSTGVRKRGSSWGALGQVLTGDGAAPGTAAFDGSMGSGASVEVGNNGGINQLNGTQKELRLFLQQIPSASLQVITS